MPRDLTKDCGNDQILDRGKKFVIESERARNISQCNQVNSFPQAKTQLKKARKARRQLEARKGIEAERNKRIQKIQTKGIQNLSEE